MKKKIEHIPKDFITNNMPPYQVKSIEIKYLVYDFIQNKEGTLIAACEELADYLHLEPRSVQNIYYSINKH